METLSPSLIRQVISQEDIPRRLALFDREMVDSVYRYGAPIGSTVVQYARHGRCMDEAKKAIDQAEEDGGAFASGTAYTADELTESKGRFARFWHAPQGGIWLTLVLGNTLLPEFTRFYPLAAGLACCELVRQYGVEAHVKWVNDVHVAGKKIAGILTETYRSKKHGEEFILIGIGLNVNNDEFPDELAGIATSMKNELHSENDLTQCTARLLAKLSWTIGLLHYAEALQLRDESDDNLLLQQWEALSDTVGRRVLFGYDVQKSPQFKALVQGIDPGGGLVLKHLDDGTTSVENAGEIIYCDE